MRVNQEPQRRKPLQEIEKASTIRNLNTSVNTAARDKTSITSKIRQDKLYS